MVNMPVCNKEGQLHQPHSLLRGCFMVEDILLIYVPTWAPEGAYEPETHGVDRVFNPPNGFKTLLIHGCRGEHINLVQVKDGSKKGRN